MATDFDKIERKLDEHGKKLDMINKTLEKLAVQDEQIRNHEKEIQGLWRKYDEKLQPTVTDIQRFQASCPRKDIDRRFSNVWWALGTVGFAVITVGVALLSVSASILGWTQ